MADQKISELTAAEAATADDLVVIVDDPAGSPVTKKLTIAELATAVAGDKLPLAGGTMTGAILFGTSGDSIGIGSYDNGTGEGGGISLVDDDGYELNWQGGRLTASDSGGLTNYDITCDSSLTLAAGKRITFGDATYIDTYTAPAAAVAVAGAGEGSVIAGGSSNTASGSYSFVTGGINTASGTYSVVTGGLYNTASAEGACVIGGQYATATIKYSRALASGSFGYANGSAQMLEYVVRGRTSGAGSVTLTNSGSPSRSAANMGVIPVSSMWAFRVRIAAYSETDNVGAAWEISGGLRRNASTAPVIVGTNTTATVTESALSTATATVVADATYNTIRILVDGIAAKDIRWVAHITATQVSNT